MKATIRRIPVGFALVLAGLWLVGAPIVSAQADDWKAMRSAGQLGERYDGLLEARDAGAESAAERINKARLALYEKRAAEMGVPADQVGRVYFNENRDQLPNGTWLHLENGDWVRK